MSLDINHLVRMHRTILTRTEKKRFLLLSGFFLVTSCFDIIGISAIGYFLAVMMDPSILQSVPIIHNIVSNLGSTTKTLILLGSLILSVFLLKTILGCWVQKELVSYCFKVGARIRIQLMEQCLYAPYSYFASNHTSEIINRILSYTNNYANLSLVSFMIMLVHSIFVLIVVLFLIILNPFITLFLIAMFGCMLSIYLFIVKDKLYIAGEKVNTTSQQIVKGVQEGLSALKEVRVLSKENFFLDRMKKDADVNADANGFISVFTKLPFYFLESLMFVFIITLCIVELSLGVSIQSIIALCGVLVAAGIRLLPSLYQISVAIITSQSSKHTLEIIYENLFHFSANFQNETFWPKRQRALMNETQKDFSRIQFENISFSYPNSQKNALNNVSINIMRGQSIGIIGPSGAGKSTFVDLLLGLLTPNKGRILLDGKPLVDYGAWVDRFAYIPQVIYLLDSTIKQNIIFGELEDTVDPFRLKQAIKMAQLEDVIANLPNGIETVIGENGIKLSGGQRQRIALARAFYHEREIIVMDEATAALDNETEHEVVEAIRHLHQLKTLIIIAHRYTTVEHCDVIYRINQGEVIDSGTFYEVIGKYQQSAHEANLILEPS